MLKVIDGCLEKEKDREQERGFQKGRSGGGKWQTAILNRSGSMRRWAEVTQAVLWVKWVGGRGNSQYRALKAGAHVMYLRSNNKTSMTAGKLARGEVMAEGKLEGGQEQVSPLNDMRATIRFRAKESHGLTCFKMSF